MTQHEPLGVPSLKEQFQQDSIQLQDVACLRLCIMLHRLMGGPCHCHICNGNCSKLELYCKPVLALLGLCTHMHNSQATARIVVNLCTQVVDIRL